MKAPIVVSSLEYFHQGFIGLDRSTVATLLSTLSLARRNARISNLVRANATLAVPESPWRIDANRLGLQFAPVGAAPWTDP
jgi:hypothetical protein